MYSLELAADGRSLDSILIKDFGLLSDSVGDRASELVLGIFGDEIASGKYRFKFDTSRYSMQWEEFKEELKHENRFFPRNTVISKILTPAGASPEFGVFSGLLAQLSYSLEAGVRLFRARVSDQPLNKSQMGMPGKTIASGGRANPVGIPYLYLAENRDTCIAEVRPSNASTVYISEFVLGCDLKLLDLTNPRSESSSVAFEENQTEDVLCFLELLERFSFELSKPVLPEKSHLEYIPTQYICEFVKSFSGYQGIIFKSSFGSGKNFVIFSDESFEACEPLTGRVVRTQHEFHVDG
ncbi:RES domain-containing protein [Pseudomonas sp. H11T01]|uniref:RES domain-containing protein n=1 Tax=Pseudomonas sp. H11T01 TaxID=3402749 RepID=UPI003ACAC433